MAGADYKAIGIEISKRLVSTKALKVMQSQKAIAVVDLKGVVTTNANGDVMSIIRDELEKHKADPSLTDFETIVKEIDGHFLQAISCVQPSSKLLYKTWVKNNAKFLKTLAKRAVRLAKKKDSRQGSAKSKKELGLKKLPRKRPPTKVTIDDDDEKPKAKIFKRPAMCAKPATGSEAAGSEAPLVSSRPPQAAGSGAPLVSSRPPPKPSAKLNSPTQSGSESGVEIVEECLVVLGREVIDAADGTAPVCTECKKPVHPTDHIAVYPTHIRHVNCILSEATLTPALDPEDGAKRRAVERKKSMKKTSEKKVPFGGDEVKAHQVHDQLMAAAQDHNRSGSWHGDPYRMKYEPTKKGSWLRTTHNVIIRWKGINKSTTQQFEFDEEARNIEQFSVALEEAFKKLMCTEGMMD
jgi:hypothetical protein